MIEKKQKDQSQLEELKNKLKSLGKLSLKVKVIPQSAHNEIVGFLDEKTLKIKLHAPAEKGKANEELIKFLSEKLAIKPYQISIKSGMTSSLKFLEINAL